MRLTKLWSFRMDNELKKMRPRPISVPGRIMFVLCFASFLGGCLFTSHTWLHHSRSNEPIEMPRIISHIKMPGSITSANDCDRKHVSSKDRQSGTIMEQVGKTHQAISSLDSSISKLEMELAVSRLDRSNDIGKGTVTTNNQTLQRAFVVVGINTAFSSRKRRDSLRQTWMPRGDKLKEVEKEKGIVVRFVIGHSATKGGILDRGIDEEDAEHGDFLRLNHVEGYHQLSTKTRLYFSTVIALWDADFYVKVDDDVHLNLGMLASILARHRSKPRIYIGCMKSGPVLYQKGVKYHEPEHWKFGEEGNRYFRHATGQIYAISKDLAAYIAINSPILHRYANEDVSLGAWLIGLEVEHIDEHAMCCGTPPDCTLKSQAGNICVASFDWGCSGICNSVERMKEIHTSCGEGDMALPNVDI